MSVEVIVNRIRDDAEEKIRRLREETDEAVAAIHRDAERRANDEYDRIIAEGKRTISFSTGKILSQATMDARKTVREEKERGLEQCFSGAEKALHYMTQTNGYKPVLKNLVVEGMDELGSDEVVVIATDRDREMIEEIKAELPEYGSRMHTTPECAISSGGVIIRSRTRNCLVNNTFEARMERLRSSLIHELSRIIFESE